MANRVITQEEVVSHLAQVKEIKTWEGFLEALASAQQEESVRGVLHNGLGMILLGNYHSPNHDSNQALRLGIDFYLRLSEPADMVPVWCRLNPWLGESFNQSIANKAWEEVLGACLHKAFHEKILKDLEDSDLNRILNLLADPHHFTEREPYRRNAREFLLKLWNQYIDFRTKPEIVNDISGRSKLLAYIETKGMLIRALVNWGLSDVLVKMVMVNRGHHYFDYRKIYHWVSYCFVNHPYNKRQKWAWSKGEEYIAEIMVLNRDVYEPIKEAAKALITLKGLRKTD